MSVVGAVVGLGVAGAVLVGIGSGRRSGSPVRYRLLAARSGVVESGVESAGVSLGPRGGVALRWALTAVGRSVRGVLRRPPDPGLELSTGASVVVGAAVALVTGPVVGVIAAAGVVAAAWWIERRRPRRREAEVREVLPDVVDLFRLAVGAGLSVHQALDVVASRAADPIGAALQEVRRRVDLGVRLGDALEALGDLGDEIRPLQSALTAGARYGAPVAAALDRAVVDARMVRRRRAEERARQLPVKLLFPLVICVLPAFVLLAVVPLLAGSLPSITSGP